jgi:predicted nucleic acid-binding protein
MWRDVEADLATGFLVRVSLDATELHAKARELSDRYTPSTGVRSLDLLHIATALLLDAKIFFSFDERQRLVAKAEGMKVQP